MREKTWSRIHLIPVLQAEEDRDLVRRYYADKAREKALLGTETKVYNCDRCVYRDALSGLGGHLPDPPYLRSRDTHTAEKY